LALTGAVAAGIGVAVTDTDVFIFGLVASSLGGMGGGTSSAASWGAVWLPLLLHKIALVASGSS
jgi:hypothetical protein